MEGTVKISNSYASQINIPYVPKARIAENPVALIHWCYEQENGKEGEFIRCETIKVRRLGQEITITTLKKSLTPLVYPKASPVTE